MHWMTVIEYVIAIIGLAVVFGLYRKQDKPTFVKVIWAFITLGILTYIIESVLRRRIEKLSEIGK